MKAGKLEILAVGFGVFLCFYFLLRERPPEPPTAEAPPVRTAAPTLDIKWYEVSRAAQTMAGRYVVGWGQTRDDVRGITARVAKDMPRHCQDCGYMEVWIVPTEYMTWGDAYAKVEITHGKVQTFIGIPPASAFDEPKWKAAGLIRMSQDELLQAHFLGDYIYNQHPEMPRDEALKYAAELASDVYGVKIGIKRANALLDGLRLNFAPFTWAGAQ